MRSFSIWSKIFGWKRADLLGKSERSVLKNIQPDSILAAALVMQFMLLAIIAIGSVLCKRLYEQWEPSYRKVGRSVYGSFILFVALITIGALVFSSSFSKDWAPVVGDIVPFSYSSAHGIELVFVVDSIAILVLTLSTGGSMRSPFTPLFFLIPTLALLLRQSPTAVIWYTAIVSVFFGFATFYGYIHVQQNRLNYDEEGAAARAFAFVSIAAFWLAVYIGITTYRI